MNSPAMKKYTNHVVKECNGEDTVTLVRKRVVFEEKVVSRKEYEEINQNLKKTTDECSIDREFYADDIEGFEDFGFSDFTDCYTRYIAFPGDVTNFTDDAIGFLFSEQPWSDYLTQEIQEASA